MNVLSDNLLTFCAKADINISEAMARFSNMDVIYLKSLGLFVADLQKYSNQLNNSNSTQDELKLIFHTLKSTAGALGFTQLAEQAKQFDQMVSTIACKDFNINDYQNFSRVLDDNLITVNELIGLLQNKPKTGSSVYPNAIDFAPTYKQLKSEVNNFNMHATDTLQLIIIPLGLLSTELTDELIAALNRLKFNDAKLILNKIDELMMEKSGHDQK